MKNRVSYIAALFAAVSGTICIVSFYALYTHPYTVHAMIANALPSTKYKYEAKAPDYKNELCDLQKCQLKAAKSAGLQTVPSTREDITSMMEILSNSRAFKFCKSPYEYIENMIHESNDI